MGPVQMLVVGFDRPDFRGELLAELERLRNDDAVRVIDLLIVHKDADGVARRVPRSGLAEGSGTGVEALLALEPEAGEELWSLDDAIPSDSTAVIALVEHRWAVGTRDAIRAAGGVAVADAWIHTDDLIAAGLTEPEDAA